MQLVTLALLVACGGRRGAEPVPQPGETGTRLGVMPVDQVFIVEVSGAPPGDTVVTTPAGIPRTVVVRHAFPDQAVFATVAFDSAAFGAGGDVTITLAPRPGAYGLDIATDRPFTSARLGFHYPVHFLPPAAAMERYGSAIGVEQAAAIGRLAGGQVTFLQSQRPATDVLTTEITEPGTYVVAAPR